VTLCVGADSAPGSIFGRTRPAAGAPYLDPVRRVWRFLATYGLDILIVGAAAESAVGTLLRNDRDHPTGALLWFETVALAAAILVMCARRRLPFVAPTVTWLGSVSLSFVDGMLITSQAGVFLAGMGAALLLGMLRHGPKARIGLVVVLVCSTVVVHNDPTHSVADLVFTPALFVLGWLVGLALRERAEQTEVAEERALRAERERETAARVAVAEERVRMARELHDVVAHAVSVMVLQVGAVRHRMPAAATEDREALGNVEQAGRTALAEMRRLLGAMRQHGEGLELTPVRGLDELPALAADVRATGLDVRLHVQGEPVPLSPALDLSAYRIVQEGLTNVLKHAGAHRADVTVAYGDDELRLEVRDDGRGGSSRNGDVDLGFGHGLVGIGERVKLYGGDMSAFTATSGGFVLRACLPLRGAGG
jgi:signal transduction histidine kinase